MTTKGRPDVGESLPVTKLTNAELEKLADEKGVELSSADLKNKASRLDALEQSGKVSDADYHDALVAAGHLEAKDDDSSKTSTETDATVPPAQTGNPTPPRPTERNVAGVPGEDDDPFAGEDLDDDLPGPIAGRDALPELVEADLPRLRELGARIRRIEKTQEHRAGGGETWWDPWTDESRLTSPDGGLDKMTQSGAIRVGRYAVVLPPEGIDPKALRRGR